LNLLLTVGQPQRELVPARASRVAQLQTVGIGQPPHGAPVVAAVGAVTQVGRGVDGQIVDADSLEETQVLVIDLVPRQLVLDKHGVRLHEPLWL
jgi:hypothetical protein